jgi:hypothetical protein
MDGQFVGNGVRAGIARQDYIQLQLEFRTFESPERASI